MHVISVKFLLQWCTPLICSINYVEIPLLWIYVSIVYQDVLCRFLNGSQVRCTNCPWWLISAAEKDRLLCYKGADIGNNWPSPMNDKSVYNIIFVILATQQFQTVRDTFFLGRNHYWWLQLSAVGGKPIFSTWTFPRLYITKSVGTHWAPTSSLPAEIPDPPDPNPPNPPDLLDPGPGMGPSGLLDHDGRIVDGCGKKLSWTNEQGNSRSRLL